MPPTEQLELRTDTVDELIDLLEASPRAQEGMMPVERRKAVADRLREQKDNPHAIALCGLPGAGKSRVADTLSEVYDAPVVSMGDAIREEAPDEVRGDSDALGDFAASWRDEAPHEIPEKVADIAQRYYRGVGQYQPEQSDLIIIDGVRSPTDFEVLNDYFDEFYLIEVTAPFYTRLGRLQNRGRDGEAEFGAVDLAERDERERNELGYGDLIGTGRRDIHFKNDGDEQALRYRLSGIVHDNLPFESENDEPLLPIVG